MKKKTINIIYLSIGFLFFAGIIIVPKITDIPLINMKTEGYDVWSIGLYKLYAHDDNLKIIPHPQVNNPILSAKDITDRKAKFIADPFIVHEGAYYMFFEVVGEDNGDIGLAKSADGVTWQYEKIVLDEPFFLSYPFVFKWEDKYFMIPESHAAKSVRLYEATNFPYEWRFVKTLLTDKYFVDSTVIRHKDKWWLFASLPTHDTLYLYYAEELEGPWIEHPKSPVRARDPNRARCGGNIIDLNGKLIRIAQDDFPSYGNSVRAFEIVTLDTQEYNEKELKESPLLKASGTGWNQNGMHQLSTCKVNGKEFLACADGVRDNQRYYFYLELPAILGKILRRLL